MWSKSVENRCKQSAVIPACPWQVSLLDSGHIHSRYTRFEVQKPAGPPHQGGFLAIQWYQKSTILVDTNFCYGHILGELPNFGEKSGFLKLSAKAAADGSVRF